MLLCTSGWVASLFSCSVGAVVLHVGGETQLVAGRRHQGSKQRILLILGHYWGSMLHGHFRQTTMALPTRVKPGEPHKL
jgi:hypothetical protein